MKELANKKSEYTEWIKCIHELKTQGMLREEESILLKEILSDEEIRNLLDEDVKNDKIKLALKRMDEFCKKRSNNTNLEEIRRACPESFKMSEKYGVNEEKYIEDKYQRSKIYMILCLIFQDKYERLKTLLDSGICTTKYAKKGTIRYNFGNVDPIEDLVTSNVSRSPMYKRKPKDLKGKEEYNFDKEGKLITFIWYKEKVEEPYCKEFFLYLKNLLIRISYAVAWGEERRYIEKVAIQKYEGERITDSCWADLNSEGIPEALNERKLVYKDGVLYRCMAEYCYCCLSLLIRTEYIFSKDEDGLLYGYKIREWIGDGLKPDLCAIHFGVPTVDKVLEIPEKKKRDTGKEAERWRRPSITAN